MVAMIGRVRVWLGHYGFIDSGPRRYFVHERELRDGAALTIDEWVEFTPIEHQRGLRARHVRPLRRDCPKCSGPIRTPQCPACGFPLEAALTPLTQEA
jgi:hypothetical protein